jgi:acyl-CoA dehydrogenase
MDFTIPDEIKMLRQLMRRFVDDELIPLEMEYGDNHYLPDELYQSLRDKAKQLGLWNLNVPEEYGGAGLSVLDNAFLTEIASRSTVPAYRAPTVFGGSATPILFEASEEIKQEFLYPALDGKIHIAFAQSEPNAGSDPGGMETFAEKQGDDWVINGRKIWISNAQRAAAVQLLAATDRSKGSHGGITAFIVPTGTPGYEIVRQIDMISSDRPCELAFVDCRIPDRYRIGEVGQGFVLGQKLLTRGRMNHGPVALGKCDRALEMAIDYARQRVVFGEPIAKKQAIQWMLADSAVEIHATRLMSYHGSWKADQGQDVRAEASIVKLHATETMGRVVDRAIQVHGAMGVTKDLVLERMYRDARTRRIGEGTSEIHRWVIARWLIGGQPYGVN